MSCVTCQVTPPPERSSDGPVHEGHVAHRFGDGGLGLAVLYRGRDVTLQAVEAFAGPEGEGWVEMRLMTDDMGPVLHPAAEPVCPACGVDRYETEEDPTADGMPGGYGVACPKCGSQALPERAYGAHVVTVIRRGPVQVVRGTEVISGPPVEVAVA